MTQFQAQTLREAANDLSSECMGFQPSWGSNEIDMAKMEAIGKCMNWLLVRAEKMEDTENLPREIVPEDWERLSGGALVSYEGTTYRFHRGDGRLYHLDGSPFLHGENGWHFAKDLKGTVTLLDHNI